MRTIHVAELWFDGDVFALNWAANCIAKLNEPSFFLVLGSINF